jgi:DNA-damage-inducible protein J
VRGSCSRQGPHRFRRRPQCLLTRIANEGALPAGLTTDAAAHDAWFRAKVQEALEDTRSAIPHEEVEAHFEARRARARTASEGRV